MDIVLWAVITGVIVARGGVHRQAGIRPGRTVTDTRPDGNG
jgi:hypothetical protein